MIGRDPLERAQAASAHLTHYSIRILNFFIHTPTGTQPDRTFLNKSSTSDNFTGSVPSLDGEILPDES